MLAELALATSAMTQITKFLKAGKDLSDAGSAIKNLVTSEEDLRARGKRKQGSLFRKLSGGNNDLEEFLALEKIEQQKKELESTMRLFCPPGTYERYVAYCGKMRKLRKEEAEERERQIAKNIRYAVYGAAALLSLAGLYGLFLMTNFLKGLQ